MLAYAINIEFSALFVNKRDPLEVVGYTQIPSDFADDWWVVFWNLSFVVTM
jgi:hypothetical protein